MLNYFITNILVLYKLMQQNWCGAPCGPFLSEKDFRVFVSMSWSWSLILLIGQLELHRGLLLQPLQVISSIYLPRVLGQECHPELQLCVLMAKCDACFDSVVESVVPRHASGGNISWLGWFTFTFRV